MRLFLPAILACLFLLALPSAALAASKAPVVEVPASKLKTMTPAEKRAARVYAKANGIRWKINWRK